MKKINYFMVLGLSLLMVSSCVSSKKFKSLKLKKASLDSSYQNIFSRLNECETLSEKLKTANDDLTKKNKLLAEQVDFLKSSNTQILTALQDMSVLTGKQAESMTQSLLSLSEKDNYIKSLQSAISRKDSLNLVLVMNLKSSLVDVNDKDINIKVEKGVVFIDISDKLLFNSGQFTVSEKSKNILSKIAKILNAHPDLDIMVEGHTDSIPVKNYICSDNWDLSVKRATSVVRILQNQYKIDPERMTAAGHGEYIPVSTNSTAEGRTLNRRTRIIILPQLDQFFKLFLKTP